MAIASLIAAAWEHDAYKTQSFGVVSLLGDEQALLIEQLIRKHLPPEECERRRLLCGNAAQFQGDERDVVFLSMVDSTNDGPLDLLKDQTFEQRYNVAASRARNQMWVVYSLNPSTDLKAGDLRLRLIQHSLDPGAIRRQLEQESARVESPFEKEVLERLIHAGYRVRSQWPVGACRIDFVVQYSEGETTLRMAVECDGDRYHPIEKLREDMARQAILERLGWRFIRIRGSEFYRNRNATMERVFGLLERAGILPQSSEIESGTEQSNHPLVESIIRRAAEIRSEWADGDSGDPTGDRPLLTIM